MTVIRVGGVEISVGNRKRGDEGTYVGRPTALGNPYQLQGESGRNNVIKRYREWLREKIETHDPVVCGAMERLRQRAVSEKKIMLVCWCAPLPCHANVIADELARAISTGGAFVEVQDERSEA